ncbi:hypothetical protein Baya_3443 [Bagarius yarrelli]|uniref:Uncharacterized protein n=1 Tax=Bagarius yarrelli TaxID=175774 RepID=A0A556TP94_BAGYA|nr:hypothetical protein Baya_3443 [Bagarius yarrelli]
MRNLWMISILCLTVFLSGERHRSKTRASDYDEKQQDARCDDAKLIILQNDDER